MKRGRIEAFSDGVIAIIITIMVLELKAPEQPTWAGLCARWPVVLSYLLSFAFVGVYWTNHHHLLATIRRVDGRIIWLNLHLLFWMSLIPFVTKWLGETYPASVPTIVYGIVMLLTGLAYSFLQRRIAGQQEHEPLRVAHRRHYRKGWLAVALYAVAIVLAWRGFVAAAIGVYVLIAIAYAMPERGFEAAPD